VRTGHLSFLLNYSSHAASSASNDPVMHFVLFLPSISRRPLYILNQEGKFLLYPTALSSFTIEGSPSSSNAFLLPQWGGIVVLNLAEYEVSPVVELSSRSLDPIFSTFADHLLALLGVPPLPPGVTRSPSDGNHILSDWQLDALMRRRSLENARGSQETLQSIVKLVDQIENMPVGQDVLGDIQDALAALEEVCDPSF